MPVCIYNNIDQNVYNIIFKTLSKSYSQAIIPKPTKDIRLGWPMAIKKGKLTSSKCHGNLQSMKAIVSGTP